MYTVSTFKSQPFEQKIRIQNKLYFFMFRSQDELASRLLRCRGAFVVHKVARAGCSVSLIKACCESGRKVVVFAPTIRILTQIEEVIREITSSKPRIAPILSNPELCTKLDLNPKLKFQFKPSCSDCKFRGKPQQCVFQDLLMNKFDIYCLTYSKLQALQKSTSEEAKQLLEKLQKCDVVIFDESTTALIRDIQTIEIETVDANGKVIRMSERIKADFDEDFMRTDQIISRDLYEKNTDLFKESKFWAIFIDYFLVQFARLKSGIFRNIVFELLPKSEMRSMLQYGWNTIARLTNEGKNTAELQDVFLTAFAEEIILKRENGTVKVTPRLEDALGYIREFCQTLSEDKLIIAVDSYQPSVNFDKIFGRPVKHILWGENGDPTGTDRQQLILCDRAHWGSFNFCKDPALQLHVRLFIEDLLGMFSPEQVIIVTTNMKMSRIISAWKLPKEVKLTYHRSDWMRGVAIEDRRVMICIGGPYLPKTAYVPEAHSFDFKDFAQKLEDMPVDQQTVPISRILRADDTRSEFVNAVGRVKDQVARERSLVITLGMKRSDVQALLRQTTEPFVSRPCLTRPLRKGGLPDDGLWISKLWADRAEIKVEDLSIIARIIHYVREKGSIAASKIALGQTSLVLEKARQYEEILRVYGVVLIRKRGGVGFMSVDKYNSW